MSTTAVIAWPPQSAPSRSQVPEEELVDLRRRLAATRWPTRELVADRSQGVQLATMQELTRYWATGDDWARVRGQAQRAAAVHDRDRRRGHPLHPRRSPHANALPLIMTHGWPGSVIELLETVGPLTDPTAHGGRAEDAFDLVLPSIPGYGFSGEPTEVGWEPGRIARAWAELMRRLGYTRYVAQGGDVGAVVTDEMGRQAPEGLVGIHTNLLVAVLAGPRRRNPSRNARRRDALATFRATGFGYFLEQATRPQTIGYALLDSPVALAAWMLDHDTDSYYKISHAFVDGQPAGNLTRDEHRRQHHALLADRHRGLGGPGVLGGRTSPAQALAAGQAPPEVSSRSASPPSPARSCGPRAAGSRLLPQPHLLQRSRPGRPLRRLGGAATLLRRDAGRVQVAA